MAVVDLVVEQLKQTHFVVRIDRLDVARIVVKANPWRKISQQPLKASSIGGDRVDVRRGAVVVELAAPVGLDADQLSLLFAERIALGESINHAAPYFAGDVSCRGKTGEEANMRRATGGCRLNL